MRALVWVGLLVAACDQQAAPLGGVAGEQGRLNFAGCANSLTLGCERTRPPRQHLMPGTSEVVTLLHHGSLPPLHGVSANPTVCRVETSIGPCCVKNAQGQCSYFIYSIEPPSCDPGDYGTVGRYFQVTAFANGSGDCGLNLETPTGLYDSLPFNVAVPVSLAVVGGETIGYGDLDALTPLSEIDIAPQSEYTVAVRPLDAAGEALVATDDFQFAVLDPRVAELNPVLGPPIFTVTSDHWWLDARSGGNTSLSVARGDLTLQLPIFVGP